MGRKIPLLILIPGLIGLGAWLLVTSARAAPEQRDDKKNFFAQNRGVLLTLLPAEKSDADKRKHLASFRVVAGDARPYLIKKFLIYNKSPLASYADLIVSEADKNGFDYRLTTAIAMCESNAGKRIPSHDSYNPFGISVYSGRTYGASFKSWEHAISWVSQYIKRRYYDQGLIDLVDIGTRWAPPSVQKGNSWATCVQSFMDRII